MWGGMSQLYYAPVKIEDLSSPNIFLLQPQKIDDFLVARFTPNFKWNRLGVTVVEMGKIELVQVKFYIKVINTCFNWLDLHASKGITTLSSDSGIILKICYYMKSTLVQSWATYDIWGEQVAIIDIWESGIISDDMCALLYSLGPSKSLGSPNMETLQTLAGRDKLRESINAFLNCWQESERGQF